MPAITRKLMIDRKLFDQNNILVATMIHAVYLR